MTSAEIVRAAEEALRRASAPICYLHRDGTAAPFAVVLSIEVFNAMGDPPDPASLDFANHGHIEADDPADDEVDEAVVRLRGRLYGVALNRTGGRERVDVTELDDDAA